MLRPSDKIRPLGHWSAHRSGGEARFRRVIDICCHRRRTPENLSTVCKGFVRKPPAGRLDGKFDKGLRGQLLAGFAEGRLADPGVQLNFMVFQYLKKTV